MEKRKFRNTGLEVSLLGMGCMSQLFRKKSGKRHR